MHHRGGSYDVRIGPGSRSALVAVLADRAPGYRPVVISDATVAELVVSPLPNPLRLTFPAGEAAKSRATWATLTDQLLTGNYGRDTVIIALGGGVTTDLAGFVAATFLRGVPWIAIPTTTLAMVDAAVGGKTGVDTEHGKNLVGAMHHPITVIVDPELLSTLPERTYRAGLAECVKHAAILDAAHGAWLHANAAAIAHRDPDTLTQLVERNIQLKAAVVQDDEFESGRRATLNAGHTVAHALEIASDFTISHGEAVAIGLVTETRYAERVGRCATGTSELLVSVLRALGLPTTVPPTMNTDRVMRALHHDKKNRAGLVRAALLSEFGAVARDGEAYTTAVDLPILQQVIVEQRQA